tara:strand:- start:47768 stop:48142 length:375 start_codon:yes stop_codon:yes gene_type:complete
MANTNITGNGTRVLDTRLWAGSPQDSTAWLQTPIGSNSALGAINMGIIDLVIPDGDAAVIYELDLATNAITGSELIGILSIHNTTTAAANTFTVAGNISTSTDLKFVTAEGVNNDVVRVTFLYR